MPKSMSVQELVIDLIATTLAEESACRSIFENLDGLRRESSEKRFGHPGALWETITTFDDTIARIDASSTRFGHNNATWQDIAAFDGDRQRREASKAIFEDDMAPWSRIFRWLADHVPTEHYEAMFSRVNSRQPFTDSQRKRESMCRFGYDNASQFKIDEYDKNREGRLESKARFGHANAEWTQIRSFDQSKFLTEAYFRAHSEAVRMKLSLKYFFRDDRNWEDTLDKALPDRNLYCG